MKVKLNSVAFRKAMAKAKTVASGRSKLPILETALFEACDDKLLITATDLDSAVVVEVPCEVIENGSCCSSARGLFYAMSAIGDVTVEIVYDGKWLVVRVPDFTQKFFVMLAEDFPVTPSPSDLLWEHKMPPADFREAIRCTAEMACQKTDTYKMLLTGVHWQPAPARSSLSIAATDTHRLSMRVLPFEASGADTGAIIPAVALKMAAGFVRNEPADSEVTISICPALARIGGANWSLVTRLLDGKYPDYARVIPANSDKSIILERASFIQALKALSVHRPNAEKVVVKVDGGKLCASVLREESAAEYIVRNAVLQDVPDGFTIAFNIRYLLDAARATACDKLELKLTDPLNPGLLAEYRDKPDKANYTQIHVVMPMQL